MVSYKERRGGVRYGWEETGMRRYGIQEWEMSMWEEVEE